MRFFAALWEALFPYIPRCVVCGTEKDVIAYLCPSCAAEMDAVRMGQTNAADIDAYAAYHYDGPAARIVQSFKYGGNRWLSAFMAQAMLSAVTETHTVFDCICYVPLHPKKRRKRGFDQAELLAQRIAGLSGKPYITAIKRVRNTPSQTKLNATERKENMRGAFEAAKAVQGRVLLVDDVLTTGATVAECVVVLKAAGAQSVTVLTFARAGEKQDIAAVSREN
jgi:ComF family protein